MLKRTITGVALIAVLVVVLLFLPAWYQVRSKSRGSNNSEPSRKTVMKEDSGYLI